MISATVPLSEFLHRVYIPSRLELSDEAIEQIAIAVRQFERWAGRTLSVYDLSEDIIRRFLADFRRTHAGSTTNSRRRDLLAVWQCAFDEDYLDRPPRRTKIRRATESPKIPEAWTPEEVGRILKAMKVETGSIASIPAPDWWTSLLLVAYDSGERRKALLATAPDDLSLDGGWVIFRATKNHRERWCALHHDTLDVVRRIYDMDRQYVWPWPWTMHWFNKRLKKILRRAGVRYGQGKGGCFHKVRRSSGTLIEAAGGDGAKHLGNTRAVFERHYRDPRFLPNQLGLLPRPRV